MNEQDDDRSYYRFCLSLFTVVVSLSLTFEGIVCRKEDTAV